MATENLVPAYLAEIYNRAIPDPVGANSPFQGFSAPIDEIKASDTVIATAVAGRPGLYGVAKYVEAEYQSRADLTYSGRVLTDAYRALGLDGDGLAAPAGLGVWEATTNLCTNGGFESGLAGWSTEVGTGLTQDSSQHKFGSKCAKLVTDGAAIEGMYSNASLAAATQYTLSAWIRADVPSTVRLRLWDSAAGAQYSPPITPTSTWTRYSFTATTGLAATNPNIGVYSKTGESGTVYVDGVQVEQKPTATPYVETNGGTATRSAARVQAPATLLNATQGWVAMRVNPGWSAATPPGAGAGAEVLFDWRTDANNRITCAYWENVQHVRTARVHGGTSDSVDAAWAPATGVAATLIFAWDAGHVYVSVNGGAFASVGTTGVLTISGTIFDLGTDVGNDPADSDFLWFACGTGTPSSADISYLNSAGVTTNPPLFSGLSSGANTTGIVLGNIATPILLLGP